LRGLSSGAHAAGATPYQGERAGRIGRRTPQQRRAKRPRDLPGCS